MEGNRDESEKCIELGIGYMNAGNYEKANKFLLKADQLYPTVRAKGENVLARVTTQ
jgi:DnaJ homolog subfamily B member 12